MILRENTFCVAIGEEHRAYVRDVLEWNEFSNARLSRLDLTVRSVPTTICTLNGANVDFNAGMLLHREEPLLVGWVMLAVMVVPYEVWNNAYSLEGLAVCLFLTVFRVNYKKSRRQHMYFVGQLTKLKTKQFITFP